MALRLQTVRLIPMLLIWEAYFENLCLKFFQAYLFGMNAAQVPQSEDFLTCNLNECQQGP